MSIDREASARGSAPFRRGEVPLGCIAPSGGRKLFTLRESRLGDPRIEVEDGVSSYIGMLFDIANGNPSIIMSKSSLYVHKCAKSVKNGAQIDPKWAPNRSQIGFRRGF